jgi:hypothetical protein
MDYSEGGCAHGHRNTRQVDNYNPVARARRKIRCIDLADAIIAAKPDRVRPVLDDLEAGRVTVLVACLILEDGPTDICPRLSRLILPPAAT